MEMELVASGFPVRNVRRQHGCSHTRDLYTERVLISDPCLTLQALTLRRARSAAG